MVRRLNFTVVWRILWAGSRRIIDMQIRSVGIDLGKTTFHLVALGDNGKVLLKKKFTQRQLITFTANLQTTLIGLEACAGAHFLGRALREQGHDVKLIPAQFVRPFVKSNKNDFLDAEAIAEAVDRQNMLVCQPSRSIPTSLPIGTRMSPWRTEACQTPPVFGLGNTQPSSLAGHMACQDNRISAKVRWRGISSSLYSVFTRPIRACTVPRVIIKVPSSKSKSDHFNARISLTLSPRHIAITTIVRKGSSSLSQICWNCPGVIINF